VQTPNQHLLKDFFMATNNEVDNYFIEQIENVSFANGVFRITLGTQEEDQKTRASVRLLIPANQISAILQGMASAAKDIDKKVQEKIGELAANPKAQKNLGTPIKGKAKK
jgi:predicted RNA-binding protein with EMAP domain